MNNVVKANNMNGMDKYDAEVVHFGIRNTRTPKTVVS